jgi:hypothetical protein
MGLPCELTEEWCDRSDLQTFKMRDWDTSQRIFVPRVFSREPSAVGDRKKHQILDSALNDPTFWHSVDPSESIEKISAERHFDGMSHGICSLHARPLDGVEQQLECAFGLRAILNAETE